MKGNNNNNKIIEIEIKIKFMFDKNVKSSIDSRVHSHRYSIERARRNENTQPKLNLKTFLLGR